MLLDKPIASPDMMNESEIYTIVIKAFDNLLKQSVDYNTRYNIAKTGKTLKKDEGGDLKTSINFFYRFCKTHAGYVIKDRPNINVPAGDPKIIESRLHAAKIEKQLNLRWTDQSITKKLKVWAMRASIFGDMYIMLNPNLDDETIELDMIDPNEIIYDTMDWDPDSEIKYVVKYKMEDTAALKKRFPQFADRITGFELDPKLKNISQFVKLQIWDNNKAAVIYYIDKNYVYTMINGSVLVETKKHWLWYIPLFHWKYIDIGDRYGQSLVDILFEPVKMMHLAISFLATNAYDLAMPALMSTWGSPSMSDQKGRMRWLIVMPEGGNVRYIDPPQSNQDLSRVIDISKSLMHFVSGMSEEAMAWFTGSLTSAWVAIELRLDSTVRETLDSQIILQDILQRVNAMALRMWEKHFGSKNIYKSKVFGKVIWQEFKGKEINEYYFNIVDFGGILPRSDAQITNSVLTKYKMGLISHDTALEELRYNDPTMEITKIYTERSSKTKLERAIQMWESNADTWFDGPKDENYYMLTSWQMVDAFPEQNHIEHLAEHKRMYDSTGNEMILLHMQMHQQFLEMWAGNQWQPSQERMNEEANAWWEQAQPVPQEQVPQEELPPEQ